MSEEKIPVQEQPEDTPKYCPEWSAILKEKTFCLGKDCVKYKTYYISTDAEKPDEKVEFSLCLDSMHVEVMKVISSELIKFNEMFGKMVDIDATLSGIEETQDVEEDEVGGYI